MADEEYFAAEGLSTSAAKMILPPWTPAHYRWFQDHPEDRPGPKAAFDTGHVMHELVLGAGQGVEAVDAENWAKLVRSGPGEGRKASLRRDEIRAAGKTPVLAAAYEEARRMAEVARNHPALSLLLDDGAPEQAMFAEDHDTGTTLKGKADWLAPGVIVDYKTVALPHGANPAERDLPRRVHGMGYHVQAAWYLELARLNGLEADRFVFAFQELAPPWLVSCVELDAGALAVGRMLMRQAIDLHAECSRAGRWPGYPPLTTITLPWWAGRDDGYEPADTSALEGFIEEIP